MTHRWKNRPINSLRNFPVPPPAPRPKNRPAAPSTPVLEPVRAASSGLSATTTDNDRRRNQRTPHHRPPPAPPPRIRASLRRPHRHPKLAPGPPPGHPGAALRYRPLLSWYGVRTKSHDLGPLSEPWPRRHTSVGCVVWYATFVAGRGATPTPAPVHAGGPPEADIDLITVTSPSLVFHPMAPLGGKESTQRCHWGETRLPLDAASPLGRPPTAPQAVSQGPQPGKPPDTPLATENGNLFLDAPIPPYRAG
jgi:hypothetical protein